MTSDSDRHEHATDASEAGAQLRKPLSSPQTGPRRTLSLRRRRSPLAASTEQLRRLDEVELRAPDGAPASFAGTLALHGCPELQPAPLEYFQINLGKMCNMCCRHCHVDASPDRFDEMMSRETIDLCLEALDRTGAHTVDLTGGAPEMNPHFRDLVEAVVDRGKHVIDRCNLTILNVHRYRDLPEWFAARGVEVVCSLPHYRRRNTDAQRGDGAYDKSLAAFARLNAVGYGLGDPHRRLTLVTNPAGAFLAGDQGSLKAEWKEQLQRNHGLSFDRLIALNNMPIARYLEWLEDSGQFQSYLQKLLDSFNPATIEGLMCRNTVSISWDGRIFDCDFNQMLDLPVAAPEGKLPHVRDLAGSWFGRRRIVTSRHCYGCTAGAGSSCGGAIDASDA